ncbi:substrate-binding domain-containing protein [Marinomonas fungiae]|uniref:Monosaccharide ABC transporter substrate-binding protein, CUT2 family (TC 3.A.1.2.-) n=1 Tax=Marinomonas fungiae TaxID=1137284 RepID=A0A0K6IMC5_9GAMM|nr:substrate-binding domain-containing protein [Marinomonas fungiae]CUB04244.1 monosaccharide ABC transporter substrate-binding protein, CUT2 family (TC 3.A.1.2.-) [Marinomonas fungiae]
MLIRFSVFIACILIGLFSLNASAADKKIAYLVSDLRIPFWNTMWRGAEFHALQLGYEIKAYSAQNSAKLELQNTVAALRSGVDGIILSPTNSSAAVTILGLAAQANIPVVISDIGTQGGEFVSYIESNNYDGAYQLGQALAQTMLSNSDYQGSVGIIAIPQQRKNGQLRTEGFLKALSEADIKTSDIRQQVDFSYTETYQFAQQLIVENPNMKALWLQGSDRYQAALDGVRDSGKEGEILLVCFDAEPEFVDMIRAKTLVAAAMQQPFLMGDKAVDTLRQYWQGISVPKIQQLDVLTVSAHNVEQLLPTIKHNVLGLIQDN